MIHLFLAMCAFIGIIAIFPWFLRAMAVAAYYAFFAFIGLGAIVLVIVLLTQHPYP